MNYRGSNRLLKSEWGKIMIKLEKYFEELKNIRTDVAIVDDKPKECIVTICEECRRKDENNNCSFEILIEWLAEEYVEHVTLNKKERMFCELVETGYVARDSDNRLYWYKNIPNKVQGAWFDPDNIISFSNIYEYSSELKFDFIKYEDENPWSVEDLLKLEVRDE